MLHLSEQTSNNEKLLSQTVGFEIKPNLIVFKYSFEEPLDSPERSIRHREIVLNKPFLKKLYIDWYKIFQKEMPDLPDGKVVEIGSGGGFLKQIEPGIHTSDIQELPGNDYTFSALNMPFNDGEISALFLLNTFHHIPDANSFLRESIRVLKPQGKIIMTEPASSILGSFIYTRFHHEPFDRKGGWTIPQNGPLSGANGALPWIVFERDRLIFDQNYPELQVLEISYHTPLRYLISGGLSFGSLAPSFSYRIFKFLDYMLSGISKQISMFTTIKVRKMTTYN